MLRHNAPAVAPFVHVPIYSFSCLKNYDFQPVGIYPKKLKLYVPGPLIAMN